MHVGYDQSWEWETSIADASRFAAWSREVELLRTFFSLPGLLIPASGPRIVLEIAPFKFSLIFPTICVYSDGGKAAVERGVRICQQLFGDPTFPRWCFDGVEGEDQVFSL